MVYYKKATTGAKEALSRLFTTYYIEEDNLNGRVHYTSKDGKGAVAYNNEFGSWVIQPAEYRYYWF